MNLSAKTKCAVESSFLKNCKFSIMKTANEQLEIFSKVQDNIQYWCLSFTFTFETSSEVAQTVTMYRPKWEHEKQKIIAVIHLGISLPE